MSNLPSLQLPRLSLPQLPRTKTEALAVVKTLALRWGPVAGGLFLSACASGLTQIPTAGATSNQWVTWSCALISTVRNISFLLAFVMGSVGMLLWAVSKFGASVMPGGFVSFAQQAVSNNVSGLLMLVLGPAIFGAAISAMSPITGMNCQ